MAKDKKSPRPKARLPKGLRDIPPEEIRAQDAMLRTIRDIYESYGFEPLDTPAFEYTEALGKFLPDQDRPNEGVFSFQDEDEQWLSLRYDLTAPLARYVAENFNDLPKPFRRYQVGPVWRNEKPGPGRFREFLQFDADTVGAPTVAADAEMCMLAADALEALGLESYEYCIRVNSRKILDGVLAAIGLGGDDKARQRLTVLRAIDKLDRLGPMAVRELLGEGREDESGDFTKGAGLGAYQINPIMNLLNSATISTALPKQSEYFLDSAHKSPFWVSIEFQNGVEELQGIENLVRAAGYGPDKIVIDTSVVRGLEYYTGAVYECELTIFDEDAMPTRFGSVGGGGRYDDLVARFTGQKVPATGFSIGVSRLYAALSMLGKLEGAKTLGPVVVTVFDKESAEDSQKLVTILRNAGIRAELYLGNPKNMGAQFKYADQRGSPCVVIQGPDEKEKGEVQIKDLIEGAKAAETIATHEEWKAERPAQFAVPEDRLVEAVRKVIERHKG